MAVIFDEVIGTVMADEQHATRAPREQPEVGPAREQPRPIRLEKELRRLARRQARLWAD